MLTKPVLPDKSALPGKLAHWVHVTLLSGLTLSGLLLVVGLVLVFVQHEPRPDSPPEAGLEFLRHALRGEGVAILNLGLLILMLTPAFRIAVLVIGWYLERDWIFTAVAAGVLALMGLSLFLGLG